MNSKHNPTRHAARRVTTIATLAALMALTACKPRAHAPATVAERMLAQADTTVSPAQRPKAAARDSLPAAATGPKPKATAKELNKVMDEMDRRLMKGTPANSVITFYGMGEHDIQVNLIFDSPRNRALVRKYLSASPLLTFSGPKEPDPVTYEAHKDTMGVTLRMEQEMYPRSIRKISARLLNNSQDTITCGYHTDLAFLDAKGIWRALPMRRLWDDVAIILPPGQSFTTTSLQPKAYATPPGRYRYYCPFYLRHQKIWLMAEFNIW